MTIPEFRIAPAAARSWERAGETERLREQSLYKGVPHGRFHTPLPENSQSRQPETTARRIRLSAPAGPLRKRLPLLVGALQGRQEHL